MPTQFHWIHDGSRNDYMIITRDRVVCRVEYQHRDMVLASLRLFEKLPDEEQRRAMLQETLER